MGLSTTGKIEVAAAMTSVGATVAGAVLLQPLILAGAFVAAVVATILQFSEARLHRREALKRNAKRALRDGQTSPV